jgi:WXXGXW repeat (2 copies)
MRKFIGAALLAAMLLTGSPALKAQISVGIGIGAPPPPRVLRVRPVAPGSGYVWVDGYWYVVDGRYVWHRGYWTLPPYGGAAWIGPRWEGGRYYNGYWNGDRGRFEHDHRWDREHERDHDRWRDHDREHEHEHR